MSLNPKLNMISQDFKWGKNSRIGSFCHILPNVEVGEAVLIRSYVQIGEFTKVGNKCIFESFVCINGECKIGNNVKIGNMSIIARGVTICDDVIIDMGSVVKNDIKEKGFYSGNLAIKVG